MNNNDNYTVDQWYQSIPDLNVRKLIYYNVNPDKLSESCHTFEGAMFCQSRAWSEMYGGIRFWQKVYTRYKYLKLKLP